MSEQVTYFFEAAKENFKKAHMENMGTVEQDTAVKFATLCALMAIAEMLRELIKGDK